MLPSPSISMVLNIAPIKVFKQAGSPSKGFPIDVVLMALINSSVVTSPSLSKSAKSAISFHNFAMISEFALYLASSQVPLPSMTVFLTGQAFEVIFVKTAIVVDVIHELNNELDAVFPSVAFCINHFAAFFCTAVLLKK